MKNLTDQQKGSLLAFVAVMFITPDSLFIRLSNVDTWGLVFYRGIIPFMTVLIGMLIIYKLNFFKILFTSGYHGIFYVITFSVTNITFVVSIQNTNVANTLVMIATAPMLSAILGAIFLKEPPDKKTWISIIITFLAIIYIFYDSLKLGNFYGDILGFVTAIGLAVGAVIIRSAKNKNLVPAAVVGKLFVATFATSLFSFTRISSKNSINYFQSITNLLSDFERINLPLEIEINVVTLSVVVSLLITPIVFIYAQFDFKNSNIDFVVEPLNSKSNYWLNAIIFQDKNQRDLFLEKTNSQGVMTRPIWTLMNKLPMYENAQCGDLNYSEWLVDRVVNIPSSIHNE